MSNLGVGPATVEERIRQVGVDRYLELHHSIQSDARKFDQAIQRRLKNALAAKRSHLDKENVEVQGKKWENKAGMIKELIQHALQDRLEACRQDLDDLVNVGRQGLPEEVRSMPWEKVVVAKAAYSARTAYTATPTSAATLATSRSVETDGATLATNRSVETDAPGFCAFKTSKWPNSVRTPRTPNFQETDSPFRMGSKQKSAGTPKHNEAGVASPQGHTYKKATAAAPVSTSALGGDDTTELLDKVLMPVTPGVPVGMDPMEKLGINEVQQRMAKLDALHQQLTASEAMINPAIPSDLRRSTLQELNMRVSDSTLG